MENHHQGEDEEEVFFTHLEHWCDLPVTTKTDGSSVREKMVILVGSGTVRLLRFPLAHQLQTG